MKRLSHRLLAGLALVTTVAVATPTTVSAQDASPEAAYRQSIMQGFRLHMGAIRAVLSGAAPAGHVEHHAVAFQALATTLANAFPEGSHGPGSRALPAIWENRTDFMNKVSAIQSATADLVSAARSGDGDRVSAAMSAVQGTCGSCHQPYRGPAR